MKGLYGFKQFHSCCWQNVSASFAQTWAVYKHLLSHMHTPGSLGLSCQSTCMYYVYTGCGGKLSSLCFMHIFYTHSGRTMTGRLVLPTEQILLYYSTLRSWSCCSLQGTKLPNVYTIWLPTSWKRLLSVVVPLYTSYKVTPHTIYASTHVREYVLVSSVWEGGTLHWCLVHSIFSVYHYIATTISF